MNPLVRALAALGIVIETLTREDAAAWLLRREIRVVVQPKIVEVER